MPDLGSAYVNIVPKAEGISGKVENLLGGGEAASGAENAGKGLGKKLLGGIAAMGIGTALVNTVKDAFEAGGALQQSFGGLETIYGDAAEGAKAYAQAAASAGISAKPNIIPANLTHQNCAIPAPQKPYSTIPNTSIGKYSSFICSQVDSLTAPKMPAAFFFPVQS